jgi:hypothetical protein
MEQQHIVFIESNNELDNTKTFAQYVFKGKRLITLIGISHEPADFGCTNPVSIGDYCTGAVKRNKNCKIMVEYCDKTKPATQCQAVNSIYESFTKEYTRLLSENPSDPELPNFDIQKSSQIFAFDLREYLLGPIIMDTLYFKHRQWTFEEDIISKRNLIDNYIKPFSKYFEVIIPYAYHTTYVYPKLKYEKQFDECDFLFLNERFKELLAQFNFVCNYILNNKIEDLNIEYTREVLKNIWIKVADYIILKMFLKNNNTNELILVVGNSHVENIIKVINESPNIKSIESIQTDKKPGDCVKLFNTLFFSSSTSKEEIVRQIEKVKVDKSIFIDILCRDINEFLRLRDYPYRIQHYNKPKMEEFRKIRDIGILNTVLSIHHSYLVMVDITDDTFASFLQYERLDIKGELLYHVHACGTTQKYLRKGLNIILKLALCQMGREEHAIYVSSIKESAFSKPMMEKFGFTFHDESIIINSNDSEYYVNVTGVLYHQEICDKVDALFKHYIIGVS